MKTTLNATIVGTAALFLVSGCDESTPVESNVRTAQDAGVPTMPAGSGAPQGSVGERVPIEMEFPPFVEEHTPKPVKVPNVLPRLKRGPVVLVPVGARLLSQGKKVTSSDDWPIIGNLDLVTDGDKETNNGYYVDLIPGLQWVQIDLEKSAEVSVVWIWHCHDTNRAYHDVLVQVSDDPEFKRGVTTVFNNDYDDSAGFGIGRDLPYVESEFGKPVDAKGARGRFVRLYSAGSTFEESNRYIEVEVYGVAGEVVR
jgi:hypothetical protein